MNIIELLGHLGNDPETRFTPSGQKVSNFRVATSVRRGGTEVTHWWRITVWGDNPLINYLKKGSAVIVLGELSKIDTYVDKNGSTQVSLEVTADAIRFPPFGNKERQNQDTNQGSTQSSQYQVKPQMQQPQSQSQYSNNVAEDPSYDYNVDEETIPF